MMGPAKVALRVLVPAFVVALSSALAAPLAVAPPAIIATIIPAILPGPLFCPLGSPLMPPSRRPLVIPLLPMSGRHGIVPRWHGQEGPGHKLGTNEYPRAVVVTAHVPAVIAEGPVLTAVEEDVDRGGRSVLHRRDTRYNHKLRRRRQVNVYVDLSLGWSSQDECEQHHESVEHE